MKPKIIALDEPMANLDPMTASKLLKLLIQLNQDLGLTVIIATHDVDLVPLFTDRVYVLNKGKVILEGQPEEVFLNTEMIRSIDLRLPRIAHLFEILRRKNNLPMNKLPLTIGEARKEILGLLNSGDMIGLKRTTKER